MASYAPGPNPCPRLILTRPERSSGGLDPVADAPARDKRTGERWIGEVDRNRIVEHAARPRRCHRPPVRVAILVEPGGHSSVLTDETFRRNGDADADWEAPFGPGDQRARIARHLVPRLSITRSRCRVQPLAQQPGPVIKLQRLRHATADSAITTGERSDYEMPDFAAA